VTKRAREEREVRRITFQGKNRQRW